MVYLALADCETGGPLWCLGGLPVTAAAAEAAAGDPAACKGTRAVLLPKWPIDMLSFFGVCPIGRRWCCCLTPAVVEERLVFLGSSWPEPAADGGIRSSRDMDTALPNLYGCGFIQHL